MSSIFQGLLNASGRLRVGAGPITSYFRSLPMNAAGEVVGGAGPIIGFVRGIPRNALGEIVGINETLPSSFGPGATPYGPNGELVNGGNVVPIASYHQGVPYDANGRYCTTATPTAIAVTASLTITPAQISASSAGFRAAPAAGTLVPATFGGGTIVLIQALNDGNVYVQNTGGVVFPGISGNITMQIGPYLGSNRVVLAWNASDRYVSNKPGLYAYMVQQIGLGTTVQFSAAPSGSAGIQKNFNMTVGTFPPNDFGYWPAAGIGALAPDTAFAGGTIARITGSYNGIDFSTVGQATGQPFPDIGQGQIELVIPSAGSESPWLLTWASGPGGYALYSSATLGSFLSTRVGQVLPITLIGLPV